MSGAFYQEEIIYSNNNSVSTERERERVTYRQIACYKIRRFLEIQLPSEADSLRTGRQNTLCQKRVVFIHGAGFYVLASTAFSDGCLKFPFCEVGGIVITTCFQGGSDYEDTAHWFTCMYLFFGEVIFILFNPHLSVRVPFSILKSSWGRDLPCVTFYKTSIEFGRKLSTGSISFNTDNTPARPGSCTLSSMIKLINKCSIFWGLIVIKCTISIILTDVVVVEMTGERGRGLRLP